MRLVLILLIIGTSSCKSQLPIADEDKTKYEDLVSDVVMGFLNWYALNKSSIDSIILVPASVDIDPNNAYSVDRNNLKAYLQKLESSGYLSGHYISTLKKYIIKCDKEIRNVKQVDGPPDGLNFDLVLRTNEVTNTISRIKGGIRFSNIHFEENKATVEVELVYVLTVVLVNDHDKWLISRIL